MPSKNGALHIVTRTVWCGVVWYGEVRCGVAFDLDVAVGVNNL